MDSYRIITKYYDPAGLAFRILSIHSQAVANKAVGLAKKLNLSGMDTGFIREASILHDIGIFFTSAPEIGCTGELPYICHGYLGHNLLLKEGLPKHALVCERHTGVGLSLADTLRFDGLLPARPMEPVTIEENIIAYCDKFFSKDPEQLDQERSVEDILKGLSGYGEEKANIFMEWHRQFNP